ncbi:MAG: chemotaxis protein CheW [Candidatus Competibacter sp.]|nr:chemotaxis protein CheW [Candidatus Competibacter sp.]MDG4604603.1 chemotaxis protein CheW [Candidatus Contendobacter sp.]HRD49402.1 chemotaxis protein CheW [Candidatus Contendobacter sp.]
MNDRLGKTPRRWLSPSAALNRFKPPRGMAIGVAPAERQRARYGFRIGGVGLLIGQDTSSEVLERAPVYPLPKAPAWLLGLVNLRGNLVPVFNVKPLLELEDGDAPDKSRLLILGGGDKAVGILIDGLPQLAATSNALPRLPPLPVALRPYVTKAYMRDNTVWLEFDHYGFFEALGGRMAGAD